jgi:hypothetical protein
VKVRSMCSECMCIIRVLRCVDVKIYTLRVCVSILCFITYNIYIML